MAFFYKVSGVISLGDNLSISGQLVSIFSYAHSVSPLPATSRKRFTRKIIFQNTPIIFYTVNPRMMFGYENIIWDGIRIPIAKPEKIIIDALYTNRIPEEKNYWNNEKREYWTAEKICRITGKRTDYE